MSEFLQLVATQVTNSSTISLDTPQPHCLRRTTAQYASQRISQERRLFNCDFELEPNTMSLATG
jgi:hypothetical protein